MTNKYFKILLITIVLSLALTLNIVTAEASWKDEAMGSASSTATRAQIDTQSDVYTISANIISIVLSVVGVIFFILIIYSGVMWMTAGGNKEKVEKAKQRIIQAIIGLIIVISAYSITYFVARSVENVAFNLVSTPSLFLASITL